MQLEMAIIHQLPLATISSNLIHGCVNKTFLQDLANPYSGWYKMINKHNSQSKD